MDIQSQINEVVAEATEGLAGKIHGIFKRVLSDVLDGESIEPRASRKSSIRKRAVKKSAKRAEKRAAGEKRDPAVLLDLQDKIYKAVVANPGRGVEELSKELKVESKELNLPLKKLRAGKHLSVTGARRATKYHPGKKAFKLEESAS